MANAESPKKRGPEKAQKIPGYFEDIATEIRRDTGRKDRKSKGASSGVIKTTAVIIDACFLDYCGGLALPEIALRKGIPEGTIRSWSRRYLWRARKTQMETEQKAKIIIENAKKSASSTVPGTNTAAHLEKAQLAEYARDSIIPFNPADFKGKSRGEMIDIYEEELGIMAMRFIHSTKRLSDDAFLAQAPKIKALDEVARKALGLEDKRPSHIINIGLLTGGIPPAMPLPPMSSNVPVLSDVTPEKADNLSDSNPLPSVD